MSTPIQREHHAEAPGYWAVQIRLASERIGAQYLCHARDDAAAFAMARRLMGSTNDVRGFDYFWIDDADLPSDGGARPAFGQYRDVREPGDWTSLLAAHGQSLDRRAQGELA
jgi:hypothetical protein